MGELAKINKQKLGYKAGWVSIIGNLILFFIKYWAGVTSMSVALIADAWHTLSDSVSSVIVLLGFKFSAKEKNEVRPFGYGRAELIASLIVGVLLSIVAFEFLKDSIEKLINFESANYGDIAIIVTGISIVVKELMAQYSFYIARKTNSKALKADGWHHRSDAISSLVIMVGIFVGGYFWWIDGVLGIIVALLLFYTSYEILSESISPLIGEEPENHIVEELNDLALKCYKRDMKLHHIHIHNYGDHVEITFHMVFPKDITLMDAHDDASMLEHRIYNDLGYYATIHMEPDGIWDDIN
ncbi:MAG: cation transporter [Ichthyobacteriaceae bacterium]|nr:cation transporter [Ichthyobacteriaceae bacterium]